MNPISCWVQITDPLDKTTGWHSSLLLAVGVQCDFALVTGLDNSIARAALHNIRIQTSRPK